MKSSLTSAAVVRSRFQCESSGLICSDVRRRRRSRVVIHVNSVGSVKWIFLLTVITSPRFLTVNDVQNTPFKFAWLGRKIATTLLRTRFVRFHGPVLLWNSYKKFVGANSFLRFHSKPGVGPTIPTAIHVADLMATANTSPSIHSNRVDRVKCLDSFNRVLFIHKIEKKFIVEIGCKLYLFFLLTCSVASGVDSVCTYFA